MKSGRASFRARHRNAGAAAAGDMDRERSTPYSAAVRTEMPVPDPHLIVGAAVSVGLITFVLTLQPNFVTENLPCRPICVGVGATSWRCRRRWRCRWSAFRVSDRSASARARPAGVVLRLSLAGWFRFLHVGLRRSLHRLGARGVRGRPSAQRIEGPPVLDPSGGLHGRDHDAGRNCRHEAHPRAVAHGIQFDQRWPLRQLVRRPIGFHGGRLCRGRIVPAPCCS